jgi:hypothetical protein
MWTWILFAIIVALLVLFFMWASRRYKQNRTNAADGPDGRSDLDRRTGGASGEARGGP